MSELAVDPSTVAVAVRFRDDTDYVVYVPRDAWVFDRPRMLNLIERVVGEASDMAANEAAAPPFYSGGSTMTPVGD